MFDKAKQKIVEVKYRKKVKKEKKRLLKRADKELEALALRYSIMKKQRRIYEIEGSEYSQEMKAALDKKIEKLKKEIIRKNEKVKIINK